MRLNVRFLVREVSTALVVLFFQTPILVLVVGAGLWLHMNAWNSFPLAWRLVELLLFLYFLAFMIGLGSWAFSCLHGICKVLAKQADFYGPVRVSTESDDGHIIDYELGPVLESGARTILYVNGILPGYYIIMEEPGPFETLNFGQTRIFGYLVDKVTSPDRSVEISTAPIVSVEAM